MKCSSPSRRRKRRGFTLMEVLLVMAILVIIGSLVSVGYMGIRKSSMKKGAATQVDLFKTSLEVYYNEMGSFPTELSQLRTAPSDATSAKKWKDGGGPYLSEDVPPDPWGNPYKYTGGGETYTVYSFGPDQQDGGGKGDDIGFTYAQ